MKNIGVISRGIKLPIIKKGDDLKNIVIEAIEKAADEGKFKLQDRDVIAITESVVARSQGNYASVDNIAFDLASRFGDKRHYVVIHPIMSRNRFAILLKGIARAANKVTVVFSYPSDEVGNALLSIDEIEEAGINPYTDILNLAQYKKTFGDKVHEFTGVDYPVYYKDLIEKENAEADILFSNSLKNIPFDGDVYIAADIHTRARTKKKLQELGVSNVIGLDNIMNESVYGSGYNSKYGLLGSNKASEESVKLFPEHGQELVEEIQKYYWDKHKRLRVSVMVYGDGAFKDPQGKIWELADPVVSPFYTPELTGTPNEIKIKYFADSKYADLKGEELNNAIKTEIHNKDSNLVGNMNSEGTTPRQLTDLLGSLCDLTSGSGDKGTPVILIQNYFNNYSQD